MIMKNHKIFTANIELELCEYLYSKNDKQFNEFINDRLITKLVELASDEELIDIVKSEDRDNLKVEYKASVIMVNPEKYLKLYDILNRSRIIVRDERGLEISLFDLL